MTAASHDGVNGRVSDCAHPECACVTTGGAQYCSDYCRAKGEERRSLEERDPGQLVAVGQLCECGHAECEERVKTGAAVHEQAR